MSCPYTLSEVLTDEKALIELENLLGETNLSIEDAEDILTHYGMIFEDFKEQLAQQMYFDAAFEGEDFTVSTDEAKDYYDMYKQQFPDEEVPPFEEVESQIIDMLEQEKQHIAINSLINQLREDADIIYM